MITIIAGGMSYHLTDTDRRKLNDLHITEVVNGCASGADTNGALWASSQGIPVKRIPAHWAVHGKAAGQIRNRKMAEYADAVVLFPGGRGTASMKREAERAGIKVYDWTNAPIERLE